MTQTDPAVEPRPGPSAAGTGDAQDVTVACASIAALGAAFSGLEPTGTWWWDPVLCAVLAVAFVAAATRVHRHALFAAVAVSTVFVGLSPWLAVALVGCAAFALSERRPDRKGEFRAISGMCALLALVHLAPLGRFGISAAVAGVAIAVVLGAAVSEMKPASRRRLGLIGAAIAGFFVLVGVYGAIRTPAIRAAADAGAEAARAGIDAARSGDTEALSVELDRAQSELSTASGILSSPLLAPIKLIPIAAQHLRAAETATEWGASVASDAQGAAIQANLADITLRQGAIDLNALEAAAPQLQRAAAGLQQAVVEIEADRSPWLLPMVDDELDDLLIEVRDVLPEAQLAAHAVEVVPGMLGADGERRYLLLFGSPAEAREFGGFIGGYGLIGADAGRLQLIAAGGTSELIPLTAVQTLDDPASYPVEYAKANPALFPQNLSSTPDLATIARAVRDVLPELEGAPIDGVLYLDPVALAAMSQLTGPITIPSLDEPLFGAEISDYIFDRQYRLFGANRNDRFEAIEQLASAMAREFAELDLPAPEEIGRILGPVARAGRLQAITYSEPENEFLRTILLQRTFAAPAGIDSMALVHANATASKLDVFLHRSVEYDVQVDDGRLRATVEVELHSDVPQEIPELVRGATDGTNEVLLTLYSPHRLLGVTVDGAAHEYVTDREFGFFRHGLFTIELPPNEGAVVRFELEGAAPVGPYRLGVWSQPLVNRDLVRVRFSNGDAEPVIGEQELDEGWLFDPLVSMNDG